MRPIRVHRKKYIKGEEATGLEGKRKVGFPSLQRWYHFFRSGDGFRTAAIFTYHSSSFYPLMIPIRTPTIDFPMCALNMGFPNARIVSRVLNVSIVDGLLNARIAEATVGDLIGSSTSIHSSLTAGAGER